MIRVADLFSTLLVLWGANISSSRASLCRNQNPHFQPNDVMSVGSIFRQLVTSSRVFADKSLLIKDLIESPHKVTIITCPENWGKSTNIDMLKTFFQPEFDVPYKRVAKKDAFNYKLFELGEADGEKLTKMNIAKHRNIMDRYLGQHPVVAFSLNIDSTSHENIFKTFSRRLHDVFEEHDYLQNVFLKQSFDARLAERAVVHRDTFYACMHSGLYNVTEEEIIMCLRFLSQRLHEHFGRRPFILIDDYDSALCRFFYSADDSSVAEQVFRTVRFLQRLMIATFADNAHFEKGLVTGVMSLEIPRLFAALPSLKLNNMVRNDFYRHYGLTEDEVLLLLKEYKITGRQAAQAKEWYGGYTVANDASVALYNIRSVSKFLSTNDTRGYSEPTSNVYTFESLFKKKEVRRLIGSLREGWSFAADLDHLFFTVDDYLALKKSVAGWSIGVTELGMKAFLKLIFSEGYLTLDAKHMERRTGGKVYVKAPNLEALSHLNRFAQ